MFSIFGKKDFLKDHLRGITDIHNHILPGIDDGAANIEESKALLQKYKDLGINSIIATPHVMNEYYPNTSKTINLSLESLKKEIQDNQEFQDITIHAAAEYMMDQHFLDILESEDILCLKEKYVLVEMSYFQAPINLNEILFKLQTKGYKPVLAHPERYAYFHNKNLEKYTDLKSRGCRFQMNLLSLTPHYGKAMQDIAQRLLNAGMIDFIGSDTHRLQHLEKIANIKLTKKNRKMVKKAITATKNLF